MTGNSATSGGGIYAAGSSHINLSGSTTVQLNSASQSGGGVWLAGSALLQVDPSSRITQNTAQQFGGGLLAAGSGFALSEVTAVVKNNSAMFDRDVSTAVTSVSLLSNSSIEGFVSRADADGSILTVMLNVSGWYGLPCEGIVASAFLQNGTVMGTSSSNRQGMVTMLLRIRMPPGQYVISFGLPGYPDAPPANLTLQVRGCQKGEATIPQLGTCQVCSTGFYSLDPAQPVCQSCPEGATCPGGAAVVPDVGYWHSGADSAQIHR